MKATAPVNPIPGTRIRGDRIRELRMKAKLTRDDMAVEYRLLGGDKRGLTARTIQALENGENKLAYAQALRYIQIILKAHGVSCTLDELFEEEPKPNGRRPARRHQPTSGYVEPIETSDAGSSKADVCVAFPARSHSSRPFIGRRAA